MKKLLLISIAIVFAMVSCDDSEKKDSSSKENKDNESVSTENEVLKDEVIWETDTTGYFIDSRDDHKYKVVKIGDQIWMAENLVYTDTINLKACTKSGIWEYNSNCWAIYGFYLPNKEKFGVVYQRDAVEHVSPNGWHVATDEDWKELELFIGMDEAEVDSTDKRGTEVAIKLMSTENWNDGLNGTDLYGFNAPPGGSFDYAGDFFFIGEVSPFWCSMQDTGAWYRMITPYGIYRLFDKLPSGYYIRCVKD